MACNWNANKCKWFQFLRIGGGCKLEGKCRGNQSNDNQQQHLLAYFSKISKLNFFRQLSNNRRSFRTSLLSVYVDKHLLLSVKYFSSGNQNVDINIILSHNKQYFLYCKYRNTNFVKAKVNWSCYVLVNILSMQSQSA